MKSVWISGAGSGIGLGLAHEMVLNRVYCATLVDKDGSNLDRALQGDLSDKNGDLIQGYRADVTDIDAQRRAFAAHVSTFGSLDVAILNAGIGETDDFITGEDWRRCLDVNLVAAMEGIRIAVQNMQRVQTAGEFQTIMVVASAGALWAMPFSPVYAASKAGIVMLVKSLAPRLWSKYRIRLIAVCPQFVDTPLVARYAATLRSTVKSMLTVPQVSRIMADIVDEDSSTIAPGDVVSLMTDGQHIVYRVSPKVTLSPYSHVPHQARKIIVERMSHDFRKATRIVSFKLNKVPKPGHVLVKNTYCGVNASDVNFSAGKYHGNKPPLPMDAGFEATGIVVAASPDVADHVRVGQQAVAFLQYGGFSEYKEVHFKHCFKVQKSTPEVIALLTSGLTASIALEQAARIQPDDTVLITAAAGGTGQFFVQLAKRAGAQVIATCGSEEKGKLLSKLGADVIVNYKLENVKDVLTKKFPKGISLVIELVGGDMFGTALKSLCPNGRLVIIGAMSQYGSGWQPSVLRGVPERLLAKNQSLIGFFLLNYAKHFQEHFNILYNLWRDSKLHVALDPKAFHGIDSVFDAVEWLQNGNSQGKVTVCLDRPQENNIIRSKL